MRLLLWIDTIDCGSSWIHLLLHRLVLGSECVGSLEASVVLILVYVVGLEAMITLLTVDGVNHNWLILRMKIRRAMMERTVQVLDGGGHLRSRTYWMSMHGFLLRLTKGGKLRSRMREGLILLIEVWSLLTWHSEDRLVLLRRPSRRLWGPIAIAWLGGTSTIWCLSWHASYLSSLRLFER